jgi:hypothetical protein
MVLAVRQEDDIWDMVPKNCERLASGNVSAAEDQCAIFVVELGKSFLKTTDLIVVASNVARASRRYAVCIDGIFDRLSDDRMLRQSQL